MAHSAVVGSPRSRISEIQQVASPTYQAPAVPGKEYVPPHPTALHVQDGGAFNVDPTTHHLDSAGPANAPLSARSRSSGGSNRFVQGFVGSIKKSMRKSGGDHLQPLKGAPSPDTAHSRRTDPPPPAPPASHHGPVHPELTFVANGSPRARSTHTARDTDTLNHDDEATAVGHEVLPVAMVMGSPVYVEPQPAWDYAKMDTPRQSISSFASYLNRVQKFFRDINELPWVSERVTVDYVPGERKGRRQVRVSRAQRPNSWYLENTPHRRELFSDSTSPTSLPAHEVPPSSYYMPPPPPEHQEHTSVMLQPARPLLDRRGNSSTVQDVLFHIDGPDEPTMADVPLARVVPYSWQNVQDPPAPIPPISPNIPAPIVAPLSAPPPEPSHPESPRPALAKPTPSVSSPRRPIDPPGSPKRDTSPSQPTPQVPFRPYGEEFLTGYVPYYDQARTTAQYSDMAVHNRTHATVAHHPSPAAGHHRSESFTTPATHTPSPTTSQASARPSAAAFPSSWDNPELLFTHPPSPTASRASARPSAAAFPSSWDNPEFLFTSDQDWPVGTATPHVAHTIIESSQSGASRSTSPERNRPPRTTAKPHPNLAAFGARSPQTQRHNAGSAVTSPNAQPSPIPSLYADRPPSVAENAHIPASMQYPYPVQTF
ncbi:hypothetical protein DXG03_000171 [Asterophora parasitica]|uniref:Uncharacterized protein n=1 Tax=Asterophora parasitica TaxID=117018 RepID=A0A9P7GKT7_9AGAR|nr:hypothetical protein DXG03_000171 [Asterophora parasitica]